MKSLFGRRLFAYVIDIIIISLLTSIICSALPERKTISQADINELDSQMFSGEITTSEYIEACKGLLYDNCKNNWVETTINVILVIGYFVVFQYTNGGQTIGKKLLKIKVVNSKDNSSPTILMGLLRTIIVFNVLSGIVSGIIINYLTKTTFTTIYLPLYLSETILELICITFIAFRKDGIGLHDLIAKTKVIEER